MRRASGRQKEPGWHEEQDDIDGAEPAPPSRSATYSTWLRTALRSRSTWSRPPEAENHQELQEVEHLNVHFDSKRSLSVQQRPLALFSLTLFLFFKRMFHAYVSVVVVAVFVHYC